MDNCHRRRRRHHCHPHRCAAIAIAIAVAAPPKPSLRRHRRRCAVIAVAAPPPSLPSLRPIAAPPNIPAERARDLQKAFHDAMHDPNLLAEARKLQLEISPVFAEEAARLIKELTETPPDILRQLKELQ